MGGGLKAARSAPQMTAVKMWFGYGLSGLPPASDRERRRGHDPADRRRLLRCGPGPRAALPAAVAAAGVRGRLAVGSCRRPPGAAGTPSSGGCLGAVTPGPGRQLRSGIGRRSVCTVPGANVRTRPARSSAKNALRRWPGRAPSAVDHCLRRPSFCPGCAHPTGLSAAPPPALRFDSPESYTPRHLAEKILTSKSALEGERKQVTVLFADLKGSMELLADRDPEEAGSSSTLYSSG